MICAVTCGLPTHVNSGTPRPYPKQSDSNKHQAGRLRYRRHSAIPAVLSGQGCVTGKLTQFSIGERIKREHPLRAVKSHGTIHNCQRRANASRKTTIQIEDEFAVSALDQQAVPVPGAADN